MPESALLSDKNISGLDITVKFHTNQHSSYSPQGIECRIHHGNFILKRHLSFGPHLGNGIPKWRQARK